MDVQYNLRTVEKTLHFNKEILSENPAYIKLIYVEEGTFNLLCNEKIYAVKNGESILIPPFFTVGIPVPSDASSVSLFSYMFCDESLALQENRELEIFNSESELSVALKNYFSHSSANTFSDMLCKKSLEYNVLSKAEALSVKTDDTAPQKMLDIIAYIEKNISQNFTAADIASACNLSESLVYKLFASEMATSPKQYIRKRKMTLASYLLTSTDIPISEIALKTGFYDQFYFSKEFKKFSGFSPSVYRRDHKF